MNGKKENKGEMIAFIDHSFPTVDTLRQLPLFLMPYLPLYYKFK